MPKPRPLGESLAIAAMVLLFCLQSSRARAQGVPAQTAAPATAEQKIELLTAAVAQAQAQMETYQQQLTDLRQQLVMLRQQMATANAASSPGKEQEVAKTDAVEAGANAPATLDEIRERQAIEESEIATHDVSKVETESKYPLKVTGLLLFNGFVNTRQVDVSASPSYATSGPGSTGLSVRQTVVGLDARGPHLLNAASHADLRADFFASGTQLNYAASGIVRLRTAHAELDWHSTVAFFQLDRSILEPNEPTSLVAVAQPELAWAGNLWGWSPQAGASHQFALSDSLRIKAEAALIDTSDPLLPGSTNTSTSPVTQTERSRWPGTEARIAILDGGNGAGPEIGVGGYFSPHRNGYGERFDAWAGSVDVRLPLSRLFEVTANAHRGQALAGLGGGGYVNYYLYTEGSELYSRALDDIGGWGQLKARPSQRVEFNTGYGTDNPFAKEIQQAMASSGDSSYPGLSRNRSFYSNAIFGPSSYLLISLEYRRLWTNDNTGSTNFSDVIGIGAGYKF